MSATIAQQSLKKMAASVVLEASWLTQLQKEFDLDYMRRLSDFLRQQKAQGKTIYPRGSEIFNAFELTPFEQVKVVILGQDPYHGPGQAHGLCFSVQPGVPVPPSLLNIFKELEQDLKIPISAHGCLTCWAEQGVLLLNSVLTVEKARAASHQGRGWERFTDQVISQLNGRREGLVFLLWGSYAQRKGQLIDRNRHLVLKAAHPSPLSAHRGFLGCGHFSKTNEFLQSKGLSTIQWQLPQATSH